MPVHISISKARGTMALALFRQFLRDCLVHGRPLQHAAPVVEHARDPFGANTVSLDPLRKGEEVVSCSIAILYKCALWRPCARGSDVPQEPTLARGSAAPRAGSQKMRSIFWVPHTAP